MESKDNYVDFFGCLMALALFFAGVAAVGIALGGCVRAWNWAIQ